MRAQPGWAEASRRLSPYLDPAIGIVAAGAALASLLTTDPGSIDPRLEDPDIVSAVATVAAAGALAWRRSRPAASYAVMVVGSLVVSLTGHYIGLLSVLMLFSLYSLAAHGRRRDGLIGLGVGVLCFVGLALLDVPDLGTSVLLQSLALLVAAWALGDAIRSRRQYQQEQVLAAVTEERLRIARELHDVVAHSMSLIAVQAGVGAHVIRTDVAAAEESLEVIAETSRRALEQTRSLLGLLREEDEDGQPAADPDDRRHRVAGPGRPCRGAGGHVDAQRLRRGDRPGRLAHRLPPGPGVTDQRDQALRRRDGVRRPAAHRRRVDVEITDPGPRARDSEHDGFGTRVGRPRRAGAAGRRHGGVRDRRARASGSTPSSRARGSR